MKLKAITLACAFLFGAGSSSAADFSIGDLSAKNSFADRSSIAGHTSFTDNWLFSISGGDNSFYGLILSTAQRTGIKSFSAILNGPNGFSAPWDLFDENLPMGFKVQGGGYHSILSSGDYTLSVSGKAIRPTSYGVALVAAPVPEPETYVMLLAGLGLIAFMARRRLSS